MAILRLYAQPDLDGSPILSLPEAERLFVRTAGHPKSTIDQIIVESERGD